jgi:hypothetical protein
MKADGHYMLLAFNLRPRVLNTTRTTKFCIYTKSELTTISTPIHHFFPLQISSVDLQKLIMLLRLRNLGKGKRIDPRA